MKDIIKVENSQEESSKQSLPYISKLLTDTKSNKTSSVFYPSQLPDNAKYMKTNRTNDIQYLHAAANSLRASSTSRLQLPSAKTLKNFKKRTFPSQRRLKNLGVDTIEEDVMLGESANILERNKYIVSKMSEWRGIVQDKEEPETRKIMSKISIDLRQFYSKKKEFLEVFEELDNANVKMDKITEVIRCYRTGIAVKMHKIMSKYQNLVELLLRLCYDNDCRAKAELERRIRMINEATHLYEDKRQRTEDEIRALYNLIKAKECELRGRKANEEALEAEVRSLREMLQIDVKDYQEIATEIGQKKSLVNRADTVKEDNQDLTANLANLHVRGRYGIIYRMLLRKWKRRIRRKVRCWSL